MGYNTIKAMQNASSDASRQKKMKDLHSLTLLVQRQMVVVFWRKAISVGMLYFILMGIEKMHT